MLKFHKVFVLLWELRKLITLRGTSSWYMAAPNHQQQHQKPPEWLNLQKRTRADQNDDNLLPREAICHLFWKLTTSEMQIQHVSSRCEQKNPLVPCYMEAGDCSPLCSSVYPSLSDTAHTPSQGNVSPAPGVRNRQRQGWAEWKWHYEVHLPALSTETFQIISTVHDL